MGVIGNSIGDYKYIDLPITAGSNPSVSYTTVGSLDLVGVEVLAKGATAAAIVVDGTTTSSISSFTNNYGAIRATAPTPGVPVSTQTGTADGYGQQYNSTGVGNVNYSGHGVSPQPTVLTSTGAVSTWTGSVAYNQPLVPADGAYTPLAAAIADSKTVAVNLTGTVAVLRSLPAADGDGIINVPVFAGQGSTLAVTYSTHDNVPFRVKATDTLLDTFAGAVRLIFQVPVSDPNTAGKADGSYPNNGVQKGSTY